MAPVIEIQNLRKTFTLHTQGGARLPVLSGASLSVSAGECVALTGASGSGKSTLMRIVYGNYRADEGAVRVCGTDVVAGPVRSILALRRDRLGYVSQFLRVVPRVATIDVVAEPCRAVGMTAEAAEARARALLARLNIPERLWSLSPLTFSGGEKQRVNIARGFAQARPALLLDEPTASLDAANRAEVLKMIAEAKAAGAAILGIFHDSSARAEICDREIDVGAFAPRTRQ